METERFAWIRQGWLLAGIAIALAAFFLFRSPREPDSLSVPLGVEQAAIVTYSGPLIAVAPFKWGVAVNVRIAGVTERPDARVYDVRFIVNRGGMFDLKDYLTAADGGQLAGLPSFKFHGDPKLSKELDARIQETEEIRVEVGGHYYATLTVLGVFWIASWFLLIFYKRSQVPAETAPAPVAPTLSEQLRDSLVQLEGEGLNAEGRAKLEMLLFRCWREELALGDMPMSAALKAMGECDRIANPLRQVQHWLHHPSSDLDRNEIHAALAPFAVADRVRESAVQP